jgi:hypothetical protein
VERGMTDGTHIPSLLIHSGGWATPQKGAGVVSKKRKVKAVKLKRNGTCGWMVLGESTFAVRVTVAESSDGDDSMWVQWWCAAFAFAPRRTSSGCGSCWQRRRRHRWTLSRQFIAL